MSFFFFIHTTTTKIYTLSLHDALPISLSHGARRAAGRFQLLRRAPRQSRSDAARHLRDRKSTRLNSSHLGISYAVFCLKKKKINIYYTFFQIYWMTDIYDYTYIEHNQS